jgi:hypothetical protein
VEPVTLGNFTSWLTPAFLYFKEWVGVILFGASICSGLVFMLWLVCKFRTQKKMWQGDYNSSTFSHWKQRLPWSLVIKN